MKHSLLSLVLLLGIGCGSENAEETPTAESPPAEAAEAPAEAAEAPAEAAEAPAEEPAEEAAEAPAEAAPENPGEAMAQAGAALGAALQAAAEGAGEGDGTLCEQAYNGAKSMIEAMAAQTGREINLPPETEFLPLCNELPEDAQQCMVPSYGMAHPECGEIMQREDVQRVRAAMQPR